MKNEKLTKCWKYSARRQQCRFQCDVEKVCAPPSASQLSLLYDTRCYFNVRSKADISQLNLPHGNLRELLLFPYFTGSRGLTKIDESVSLFSSANFSCIEEECRTLALCVSAYLQSTAK